MSDKQTKDVAAKPVAPGKKGEENKKKEENKDKDGLPIDELVSNPVPNINNFCE